MRRVTLIVKALLKVVYITIFKNAFNLALAPFQSYDKRIKAYI